MRLLNLTLALTLAAAVLLAQQPAGKGKATPQPPKEFASAADILSIHLALGPGTRGLVDADLIGRLRDGARATGSSSPARRSRTIRMR